MDIKKGLIKVVYSLISFIMLSNRYAKMLKNIITIVLILKVEKGMYIMRKKVNKYMIGYILIRLMGLSSRETMNLMQRDDQNPRELREIIRQYVVPAFMEYNQWSQQTMQISLEYYLGTNSALLDRVLPMFQIPLDPPSGHDFFLMVWQELFGTDSPPQINPHDYVEDFSLTFANSVRKANAF